MMIEINSYQIPVPIFDPFGYNWRTPCSSKLGTTSSVCTKQVNHQELEKIRMIIKPNNYVFFPHEVQDIEITFLLLFPYQKNLELKSQTNFQSQSNSQCSHELFWKPQMGKGLRKISQCNWLRSKCMSLRSAEAALEPI